MTPVEAGARGAGAAASGTLAFGAGAVLAALLAGILTVTAPRLLNVDVPLSWSLLVAAVAAVPLLALALRRPDLGLPLLVLIVYLNLSEVLVRRHHGPSLLSLLFVALCVGVRLRGGPGLGLRLFRPLTAALVAYTLVLLVSTTWARSPELADERVIGHVKALAIYLLVAALSSSLGVLRRGVWALVGAAFLLGAIAVVQVATRTYGTAYFGLARVKYAQIHGTVFEPRIAGPLGDPNFFAQILVLVVPLALFEAWGAARRPARLGAWVAVALVTAAAVLTYSRGGALALGAVLGLSLLAHRVRPRQLVVGVSLAAVLWLARPEGFATRLATLGQILPGAESVLRPDSSFQKRKLLTQAALHIFLEHPLGGVGAGNYAAHFEEAAAAVGSASRDYEEPDERPYPHSFFLEIAAETGLLGLLAFGVVLACAFAALGRARARLQAAGQQAGAGLAVALAVALAGQMVSGLFLHDAFPRYLWMLLGFAAALSALAEGVEPRGAPTPAA